MLFNRRAIRVEGQAASSPGNDGLDGARRVGAELCAAREHLGWSLPDIAAHLRIRLAFLAAIEQGRLDQLPGTAYAMGFVRTYAKSLGLDPDAVAQRFRAEAAAVGRRTELAFPAPVPERGVPAGAVVLLGAVLAIGAYAGWYQATGEQPGDEPVRPVPERLAALAPPPSPSPTVAQARGTAVDAGRGSPGLDLAGPAIGNAPGGAAPLPMTPLPVVPGTARLLPGTPTAAFAAAPATAPAAAPAPATAAPAQDATPEGVRILLRAKAESWLQVRDRQGQVVLNRVLRAGETWPVPAQGRFLLTTGNAGGTELLVDGVVAPPLGANGVVRRDLALEPDLIRDGKLASPVAAARPAAPANAPANGTATGAATGAAPAVRSP